MDYVRDTGVVKIKMSPFLLLVVMLCMALFLSVKNAHAQKAIILTNLKIFKSETFRLNSKLSFKSEEHPMGKKSVVRYIFKD